VRATFIDASKIEDLPTLIVEGMRNSVQRRNEEENNCRLTESIQIFMPTSSDRDAQLLIQVSNRDGWDILRQLDILQSV
jgi:hypothetical protein